jgi:hypothetical protein
MTQVRELELTLYGDEQVEWLKKWFKGENKQNQETISRREFLRRGKQVGIATAGVYITNSILGKTAQYLNENNLGNKVTKFAQKNLGTKKAEAKPSYHDLLTRRRLSFEKYIEMGYPPGIADAATRRATFADAWDALKNKDYDLVTTILFKIMDTEEVLTEPAFFFLGNHCWFFDQVSKNGITYEELRQKNPAMDYFDTTIGKYIRKYSPYLQSNMLSRRIKGNIAQDGIIAIFFAAGMELEDFKQFGYNINPPGNYFAKMENIANQYLEKPINEKKIVLQLAMKKLKKRDKIQQRIAAWTAFWLGLYFEIRIKDESNSNLIYNHIELPLRNINKQFKIRGPPYY